MNASDEMSAAMDDASELCGPPEPHVHEPGPPPCDHAEAEVSCPWCIVRRQGDELRHLRARIGKAHDAMVKGAADALALVKGLR